MPYKTFVKSKFYIGHKLTNEGKLQRNNPYVTYVLTKEAEEQVYSKEFAEREKVIKDVPKNHETTKKGLLFAVNVPPTKYCELTLTQENYEALVYAVRNHYWYQMYLDDLPLWGE